MILVSFDRREYIDESLIVFRENSMRIYPVLCLTKWANNKTAVIGEGFNEEIANVKARYKDVTKEAVEIYNEYVVAKFA